MIYGQREYMRKLYSEHGGDRDAILEAYVSADERGMVRRTKNGNGVSSKEYAIRLWANGMYNGWLGSEHPSVKKPGSIGRANNGPVDLFEGPLAEMGIQWLEDPARPQPTETALKHWSSLIDEWCITEEMPLLIRKGGPRGLEGRLQSGRKFVRCDNSPAHWAYMGCCANELPSLQEVSTQLECGHLPVTMARARAEKALIDAGTHTACGGFINRSKYGQVNKFPNGRAFKLCHLRAVGLGLRGEVEELDESALLKHMKLLLDPANMIVVPLRYSGVGECEAFLRAFLV